jgi:CubicO group peptidase (beta-lactamase class C family)
MKNNRLRLVAAVALLALPALGETLSTAALSARIARVENSLLPPARIAGTTSEPWSIESRMTFHTVPGVSLAVIADGKIAWTRGYGFSRGDGHTPVTTDTLFQAGALSKPVAAAAALALVDAGQLALDTPANAKLSSWKILGPTGASAAAVTLRQLLSHTAGLSVPYFSGYAPDAPPPTLLQILDGQPPANSAPVRVTHAPGAKWQYSSGGFAVLQQLMLDATGEAFPAILHRRLFVPAGMTASTFTQPIPGDSRVYPELAAAGLWTTPGDLARFVLALRHSLEPTDTPDRIMQPATAAAMITPLLGGSDYGLGIGVLGSGESLQLAHSGSTAGFRCSLVFYPRLGRGAIVMTNSDNGGAVIPEILRALAREYAWPDYQIVERSVVRLPPSTYDHLVGRYSREETTLSFTRNGDRYFLRATGQPRREIFPSTEHEFFVLDGAERFSFARNADGEITHVVRYAPSPQIFRPTR